MKYLYISQQTDEWLKIRQEKIGASDAPVIMLESPWKSPYKLWEEKMGFKSNNAKSFAMSRGIEMEPVARRAFEKTIGIKMQPNIILHSEYEWMMASLDGIDLDEKHIVEIKCAGAIDHALAQSGQVPRKYFPQLQHQLEVCRLNMVYYYSFDGQDGVILEVGRDQGYIDEMVKEEKAFWDGVQDWKPPKMGRPRDDDQHIVRLTEELISLQPALKRDEEIREELKKLAEGYSYSCKGVKVSKFMSKGRVDYSTVPALQDINLEPYRKPPQESWRISIE